MSECKCGNCGHEHASGFEGVYMCPVCGYRATERGHFARRLERVEKMTRSVWAARANESGDTHWCLMDAIKQIDALDGWAQAQGGAK